MYSFHNKLKTSYLHGKVNRRVDFLLNVLLRIEEDNFFNYMKKVQLPTTQQNECNRHQNGMIIPAENVRVSLSLWFFAWLFIMFNFIMKRVDSNTWYVPSVSGKISDGYFVRLKMNLCTECTESTLTCTMIECKKLCYYMYECDQLCYDYTKENSIAQTIQIAQHRLYKWSSL